jgi:phosphoglycolate phosphatase-like HAD superfamily hydrolase
MQAVIFDLDETLLASGTTLHDGVADLLQVLRTLGFRLGVVSDGDHRALVRLEETGIRHFFDGVVCADQRVGPKTPIALQRLTEQLGADPELSTFVGHTQNDILSGKHAGLRQTIRVAHGQSADDRYPIDADHVVGTVPAVLDVIG